MVTVSSEAACTRAFTSRRRDWRMALSGGSSCPRRGQRSEALRRGHQKSASRHRRLGFIVTRSCRFSPCSSSPLPSPDARPRAHAGTCRMTANVGDLAVDLRVVRVQGMRSACRIPAMIMPELAMAALGNIQFLPMPAAPEWKTAIF